MTGSEKTGYANSDAALLKGAYYLLTPTKETNPEYVEWLKNFVNSVGSLCMVLDEVSHDRITAGISHCPHIISAALVNTVADRDNKGYYRQLAAGGFRDITRISSSSPQMWQNICLTNPDGILDFLEDYIARLEQIKTNIKTGDEHALTEFFSNAKAYRDSLPHGKKNP